MLLRVAQWTSCTKTKLANKKKDCLSHTQNEQITPYMTFRLRDALILPLNMLAVIRFCLQLLKTQFERMLVLRRHGFDIVLGLRWSHRPQTWAGFVFCSHWHTRFRTKPTCKSIVFVLTCLNYFSHEVCIEILSLGRFSLIRISDRASCGPSHVFLYIDKGWHPSQVHVLWIC